MTVIKKTKLTPEDVKKVISQRYIVTQRDNNVYIFSANTKIQKLIKEQFPRQNIEVQNSNQDLYKEAIPEQNKYNLNIFLEENPLADKIYVVITSTGIEGQKANLAEQFLNKIFQNVRDIEKAHVSYRSWLRSTLKEYAQECDIQFRYSCKQYEIIRPKDKAIVIKGYISTQQANDMVDVLAEIPFPPQCMFFLRRATNAPVVRNAIPTNTTDKNHNVSPQKKKQPPQQNKHHVNVPPNINIDAIPNRQPPQREQNKTLIIDLTQYTDALGKVKPVVAKMFPDMTITARDNKIYITCQANKVNEAKTALKRIKLNNEELQVDVE